MEPNSTSGLSNKTERFLREYDDGSYLFESLRYRVGAPITVSFGLTNGYRLTPNGAVWDSIRLHSGVDRGGGKVYAPFDFERSEFSDYGNSHPYGSLVRLFNEEYGFELRIAHMNPSGGFDSKAYNLLINRKPIKRNTVLGIAGNYGLSFGAHTHTELVSIDEQSEVLDEILYEKFGERASEPYTEDQIIERYHSRPYWTGKPWSEIRAHYKEECKKRRVVARVVNDYQYRFKDWFADWKPRTRYSTELIFNGL